MLTLYYRQPEYILLVLSIDATCFGHVDHPWALKCMTLKTQETRQAIHVQCNT